MLNYRGKLVGDLNRAAKIWIGERMTATNILDELKRLNNTERLAVIETATRLIREELRQQTLSPLAETNQQLAQAAEALLSDYTSNSELTAFTSLDGEDFRHA